LKRGRGDRHKAKGPRRPSEIDKAFHPNGILTTTSFHPSTVVLPYGAGRAGGAGLRAARPVEYGTYSHPTLPESLYARNHTSAVSQLIIPRGKLQERFGPPASQARAVRAGRAQGPRKARIRNRRRLVWGDVFKVVLFTVGNRGMVITISVVSSLLHLPASEQNQSHVH